jgi:hypothetical protein
LNFEKSVPGMELVRTSCAETAGITAAEIGMAIIAANKQART